MLAYYIHFAFIALFNHLAAESTSIKCNPDIDPHRPVRKEECLKAISQIVYNPDNTLDLASKLADYTYGECNISIYNELGSRITKSEVEARFNEILEKCRYDAGGTTTHSKDPIWFYTGIRALGGFQSWDSDFPARLPTCAINDDNAKPLTKDDCMK
ncbi:hypothetical protein PTTG_25820 [Puccinia triticina 1-1 BBBD Race 1]|uniref:Uncharacterized protein n=2 Tax=Puccinia triticina TaxID=208348 RepID=A0A180GZ70_PUCT1|nr:hypothetical protein PTTG_25820 [Puccinia triticina 1-1 BBBD Race 1]